MTKRWIRPKSATFAPLSAKSWAIFNAKSCKEMSGLTFHFPSWLSQYFLGGMGPHPFLSVSATYAKIAKGGSIMLSEKNYAELLRFQNTLVPYNQKLSEREQMLLDGGYLCIAYRRKTETGNGYTLTLPTPKGVGFSVR